MYACYRREDAADAATMLDAAAIVLANYPDEVMETVTHPVTGIPGRMKWPPNIAEIREACAIAMGPIRAQEERERRHEGFRALPPEPPRERLSAEQIAEKYGPNYGLKQTESNEQQRAIARDRLRDANRRVFEHECVREGMDPATATVSPALAKMIRGTSKA